MKFLYMTPALESDVQWVHQISYGLCFSNKSIQPQCSINSDAIIQKIKKSTLNTGQYIFFARN